MRRNPRHALPPERSASRSVRRAPAAPTSSGALAATPFRQSVRPDIGVASAACYLFVVQDPITATAMDRVAGPAVLGSA